MRDHLPAIGFALLFGCGMVFGGNAVLSALPEFLDIALSAAHATSARAELGPAPAYLELSQSFRPSAYSPQVLYPIYSVAYPRWLTPISFPKRAFEVAAAHDRGPAIAICIDDLGEDLAATDRAMMLPKQIALSFLPYAQTTPFLAEAAARRGHLILAHVPMQALGRQDPGPMALRITMSNDEIARRLAWNLARVPSLAGINNHEGSLFTSDADSLAPVAAILRARHLFFLDSRTGPVSKVEEVASAYGVLSASRDIFLDDSVAPAAIKQELAALIETAQRNGVAIAIGHPHDATLAILASWLKLDHGVRLIALDEAMRIKNSPLMLARH